MRMLLVVAALLGAPQAPPDTEIFLAPLTETGGRLVVGTPANVTNSPGYDNQPAFTPDGRAMLFTSMRDASPSAAAGDAAAALRRTDIYRYDLASKQVTRVTRTADGEYSPTVTPDGRHISAIRVESDGTQRLWQYAEDGSAPRVLLPDVKPVGYHAWIDSHTLALFILGSRNTPATLQVADTNTGTAQVVATGIGRSLVRSPAGGVTFVQRTMEGPAAALMVKLLRGPAAAPTTLVPAVAGAAEADLAWTPGGTLLMAYDGKLYAWRDGSSAWTVAADLDALGLRGATRLAVHPRGHLVAIVAQVTR